MFKLRNVTILCTKSVFSSNVMPACLPWCCISSSFKTVWHLGIEVMSFWSFGVGIWSHSCLVSSCWRAHCHLFDVFFRLIMHQMFSLGNRSGLQAGQFSTRTLLLRSYAVVIAAVCGFALSCCNTQGLPWNKRHLEGSIFNSSLLV